jgi:hypothetical protein
MSNISHIKNETRYQQAINIIKIKYNKEVSLKAFVNDSHEIISNYKNTNYYSYITFLKYLKDETSAPLSIVKAYGEVLIILDVLDFEGFYGFGNINTDDLYWLIYTGNNIDSLLLKKKLEML